MLEIKKYFILVAITYLIFFNKGIIGQSCLSVLINRLLAIGRLSSILLMVNVTADPCQNFYKYSCGNGYPFGEENIQEVTQFLDAEYNKKLMQLLIPKLAQTKNLFHNKKQTIEEKTLYYYEACCKENPKNVKKYFEELQLQWPLLGNESRAYTNENFWQILGQLQSYNWNNLIIKHEITANKDGTLNIILEPGLTQLPSDNDIVNHLRFLNAYNKHVVEELKAVEWNWYEVYRALNDNNSENHTTELSYQLMALQYPFLRIYLKELLNQKVNNIDKVTLENISFFKYLYVIQWSSDMLQQQLNYLMMHFYVYLMEDSTRGFNHQACIEDLRNKLDMPVDYMYFKEILHQDVHINSHLKRIKEDLVSIAAKVFDENNLKLSCEQIKNLKNKLQNIRINVGNLPSTMTNETIETIYAEVPNLDKRNYFQNHLVLLKHRFVKSLAYQEDLDYFICPDNEASSGTMYYLPKQNLIVIPFANVQYPLYQHGTALLFVPVMGFLIAHEMGHAFDISGLSTIGDSSILQQPSYLESLICLQNQEPTDYISERIADLFAERVAYRTYEKHYIDWQNWQQAFYVIMAQFFCYKDNSQFVEHDASDVRLHQIVKNSHEFAKAFNCPLDSPMNPQTKCRLY